MHPAAPPAAVEHVVPVARAFARINTALRPSPSIAEVQSALDNLVVSAHDWVQAEGSGGRARTPPATPPLQDEDGAAMGTGPTSSAPGPVRPATPTAGPGLEHATPAHSPLQDGPDPLEGVAALFEETAPPPGQDVDAANIATLFAAPVPSVLTCPPPVPRPRQRRTFDVSTTRRSARLAAKPRLPVAEMAQRNLWRKLGLGPGEDTPVPVEQVLHDVVAMFSGALPPHIIGAMTTIFDLDNEDADATDDALIQQAGQGVDDLQLDAGTQAP